MTNKKIGFYRKNKGSNKWLIAIFEEIQQLRLKDNDWPRITSLQDEAMREIFKLMEHGKLRTSDDFYRAAFIFHHGKDFRSYSVAVALAASSMHLGEPWGRNLYAVTLDRFLMSIKLPQYFGSQFEKRGNKYVLSSYNRTTTDEIRKMYFVEPLSILKKGLSVQPASSQKSDK